MDVFGLEHGQISNSTSFRNTIGRVSIGADFNFRNKLLKSADIGKVSYLRLLMSLPIITLGGKGNCFIFC